MKAARDYPILTVTAKGTRWLESGHPWVYDSDVAREPDESECENGALVDVVSEKGKYLGAGFLSRLSKLRVRIVSRNANDRFAEIFWRRRVRYAWDYRKAVMDGQTGCCRLIFGEADAFPGLPVDRFENLLVTQTLSLGMEKIKDMLFPLIVEVLEQDGETIDGLFERNDVGLREKEGLTQNKGWFPLPGKKTPESPITEICENGVFYRVDVENGQKTGFFLDQMFNRLAVAHLAHGKRVRKGEPITDGALNPHDVLRISGVEAVQDYLTQGVLAVYRQQGVDINEKHIEVIIRQMMRKVKVEEPGDTNLLSGTVVDIFEFEDANAAVQARIDAGETDLKPATDSLILMGITKASLATESWLSAASFQETTKVLTDAAIKGKVDHLIGLKENVIIGKLIPAGSGLKAYRDFDTLTTPESIVTEEMIDDEKL